MNSIWNSNRHNPRVDALSAVLISDLAHFSRHVIGVPLYGYQLTPLRAVLDSVLRRRGREYLLVFPRQSGKNEAVAQLLVYLLVLLQRRGGRVVYGAVGDGVGRGRQRLEARLDNPLTRGRWRREGRPDRVVLGRAAVAFLSTHPRAAGRGETADPLLVIDEAQDQDAAHIEAVFTPMRAAHNATAVYLGTARLNTDFLWAKKGELEAMSAGDGAPRVFFVGPEAVTAENPDYAAFLAEQVRRYGRRHPIIAAEYFLEPGGGDGRLFPDWRLALMRGAHCRRRAPCPGELYVAAIDPAGQDELTAPGHTLRNPERDYTVVTIFRVRSESYPGDADVPDGSNESGLGAETGPTAACGPVYEAVDVFVDHGSRHFQSVPGRTRLADVLLAYLGHWDDAGGLAHVIIDSGGVGQGLADWLAAQLGPARVTPFQFNGPATARLGSDFLALVDTGRFKYWDNEEDPDSQTSGCGRNEVPPAGITLSPGPASDAWWFFRQAAACAYSLSGRGRFDRDLRWGVPDSTRISVMGEPARPLHDDRLLSAALVAEIERRRATGALALGAAASRVLRAPDPLHSSTF